MRTFKKSSYSSGNESCVEIAIFPDVIAIRDSKNPHGPMLLLPSGGYRSFITSIVKETR
ncbi:DUF397 domain-containing protein [Streptomyces sp. NPDC020799]|uniref:DUF397 domain-containing protein n=1 Tax=unclassified Streptomyces TaxID=2593676 RepID=UPI0033DCFB5C